MTIEKTAFLQWLLQRSDDPKKLASLIRHLIATSGKGEYEQLWEIMRGTWENKQVNEDPFLTAANLILSVYEIEKV